MAFAFVYIVASGPKYKFTFPKLVKFWIPLYGLVYLTPDVSTYIPIVVTSEVCSVRYLGHALFPNSSLVERSIILVPPDWILFLRVMLLA